MPLLVSRFLIGDDRYVMSCPVTFLVADRGRPSKTFYFSGQNRHHNINFLNPKLLNTEGELYRHCLRRFNVTEQVEHACVLPPYHDPSLSAGGRFQSLRKVHYSIVLQWLLHRPQRQHCTALVAPRARAVGRATNKMGSEPAHLASGRATIAPSTRHWAQQLVVTITLGRAVVRVAPASTTTHPGRSTRLDWPPCLYCRPKAVFAQNINICSLSDLRLNSPPPSAKKHIETRYFYQTW